MQYVSRNGHGQSPSDGESTVKFIARCVRAAREEFIREVAGLRKRQHQANFKAEDDEEDFDLKNWTAPFK